MPNRYRDGPQFSPDDDYRDHRHSPQQADNDPLAELARLIGQTDPFSNFGRDHADAPRRADPRDQYGYDDGNYQQGNDPYGAGQGGHDTRGWAQDGYDEQGGYGQPERTQPAYDEPAFDDLPPGPPSWMRNAQPAPAALNGHAYEDEQFDLHADYRDHAAAPLARGGYDQHSQFDEPRFEQPQDARSRYDDVLYGEHPDQGADSRYDRDPRYDQLGYEQDDGYAEEPQVKPRRGGTLTVIVVLALAVLGTAGAYAYRSFVGSPRSGEPPIIKADAGPNKIVPPSGDKQIYDRVGDKSGERVVSREEQPVDVNSQASGPRVVFPPLSQNASPPTTSAVSPSGRPTGPGVGNGTLGGDEPRKIRTLTIRPDGTEAAPVSAPAPAPPPAASVPARTIPMTGTRSAAPSASGAPIALAPPAAEQPTPAAPAPRARVASVNPATAAPSAGGSYVQISSQKTEADALASYKVLQGKYSGILGARSPVVRRADLGDKGVYYRALVGPFGTTEEATQFCVNLQSAGGKCIVQRN